MKRRQQGAIPIFFKQTRRKTAVLFAGSTPDVEQQDIQRHFQGKVLLVSLFGGLQKHKQCSLYRVHRPFFALTPEVRTPGSCRQQIKTDLPNRRCAYRGNL
jgi:hypothetical protein